MSQVLDDKQPRKDKAKQKYEPIDFYQKNTYVDCKDSVNAWCVARILERCDDDFTLKINFDGWSHKWDEWVRFSSTRLAPFRKYSVGICYHGSSCLIVIGYTGQTKFAIRDWRFSLAELKMRTERLKEIIDSNFTVFKSPFQITQCLRGSEFIYVDCLMEHEYSNPKEELPYVFKHFEVCFELYITFLKMIPEYLPDYFEGISNLDSFLTNERIALILSIHEVSEIVNCIFAFSDRLWQQFRSYDSEAYGSLLVTPEEHAGKDINTVWTADEKEEESDNYVPRRSKKHSKLICKLVNKFGSVGGIDAWMKAFTYYKEHEENTHNPNLVQLLPFKLMEVLLKTLSNIYGYLNKDIAENMIVTIKDVIMKRLEFIPDRELKELDRDDITKFIAKVQSLLVQYYSRDEVISLTETAELDLDLKFLTCSFFEKRLKGIVRIKELAEKIDLYEQDPKIASQSSSPKLLKHLDSKTFIAWIFKNRIFELILGDSIHTEIIKRTHEILKFIGKYDTIPNSLLELLWNACEGKHEATLMGLYDVIVDIAGHLEPEGVSFLKAKIEAIPDDQQNEMTLNLIKGFAENTLPRLTEDELDQGSIVDESRFNCVATIWHLMLDESKVNIGMSEAALKNMVSILREPACQSLRKVYLFRCFEQVSKKDSVSQCINLIHSILNGQYYTRGYDSRNSLGAILEQLDEKFGLMELLVSEFEHFYTQVGELVRKHHHGDIPEELKDRSIIGKYSYSVNYHNRLIFLNYLVTNQAYELILTVDQMERLWNLVALNPIWESDRDYFFQWLSFRYEGQTYIRPVCVINKNLMGEFFEKILGNQRKLDFANLSPKGFEMFVSHFKALNEQKANFRVDRALKFLIDDLDYDGKDTLWSIFLHCKNEKTIKSVINLLVECHLQIGSGLEKKKKQLWEDFTYKCVNLLKEGHDKQDDKLITKAVIILMHFFDKFEGKNRLELAKDDNARNSYNMRITAILKPEQNMKSVLVNSQQTIGYLKGLIADRFGYLIDEVEISVRGNTIENDEDSNPLANYPVSEPFIVQRAQMARTQDGGYHPKQLIAENVECIDLLFQLLSEDLQAVNSIWELLVRLPVSEKTKQSIYEMSNPWETLLGGQSMQQYKLLYCLQIIEDFLFDQSLEKPKSVYKALDSIPTQFIDPNWAQRFYESGGLRTLLDVLSKPEIVDIKSNISLKCLTLLLKIVCAFFTKYNFDMIYGEDAKKKEGEVTKRVIEIIHNTSEYSINREHKEPKTDPSTQPFVKTFSKTNDEILRVPEDLFFESKVIYYAQSLFLSLVQHNTTLLTHIYEYPSLQRMLSIGLIDTNNAYLKEKLSQGLLNLMTQFPKADAPLLPHHIFVPVLLQDTLQKALENEDRSEVFFRMLTSLINHINIGEVSLDADDLLSQLVDFLKLRKPMEKNQRDFDIVLHGVLLVLKGLFARYPDKAQKYGQEEELVIELLQNCLFEIPRRVDRKQVPGPKCKNIHTRSAAYKLLIELSRDSDFNLQEIIEYIKPIHQYGKWRTKRFLDWNIVQKDNEKSSTGYVGLKNLGCICYMNSTIQQIYMIPSFRNAILEVEDKQLALTPKEDNILYQLKCIFGALNESEKQYFNPKNFCQSFKDWDGNPTNVYEQMDADEFFLMFMDRLENLIKGTKQENFIKQHFGGVLSNELICKGCPHYSEREEPFLAVSLQVKNKKNIYQSLAAFVEGEMLEGDNAYHCAQCDKKVNTLKRVCLKKLPNHLILVLKRFEFDFDTMAKVKVNDYCEFPTKLDLEPYTQQGLRKAEKAKHAENKEGEQENDAEVQDEYPKSYFEYKLTGIVIHVGFADSGHYISLAQDREANENPEEQRWYEFNDTEVRFFDPKEIPAEAYGGEEKWRHFSSNSNMTSYREKIKNAYLLFYERITHFDDPQQNVQPDPNAVVQKKEEEFKEDQEERLSFSTAATDRPPSHLKMIRSDRAPGIFRRLEIEPKISDDSKKHYPQDFLHGLLEKNQIFLIHKHVFSKEYFDFIQELVMQRQYVPRLQYTPNEALSPADNAKEYYDLELIKFGTLFLLTAVLRDRMRTNIIKFLPFIKEKLSQNIQASVWLLEIFSSKKIQLEFFLDCPIADMRRFAIGVVITAFRAIYNFKLKEGGEPFVGGKSIRMDKSLSSILTNFVNCSINLIFEAKASARHYTEFFKLFYEIAQCGHHAVGYLIGRKLIGRFMDFFYEDVSPLNAFFRDMSDVPYLEPENSEIGEPQEEKTKVRTAWEEYMFKKKDKQIIESFSAKSYLWKTLCYLLLHCKMSSSSQKCEWQIGDYDYQLLQKEKTLLTPDTKFVIKVLDDADTKISYRSVARFYSYLCYEDEDFTSTFIEAIKSCLNVNDTTCLRPSLRCFTTLLTVQDSLADFRVKQLLEFFMNLMNNSSLYYLEVDAYTAFLLKITSKLDNVKEWVLSHKETWNWVINWLTKHPIPPIGMTQDHIKLQKRRNAAGAPILHNRIHEYQGIASIKLRKFKKMMQDEIEDPKNKWDSDEDLSEHKFVVGEKVDFDPHKTGRWCTAEVEHVLEEMIKLTFYVNEKDQDFQWVSKDIPNLALPNTMTAVQAQIETESQKFLETENNAGQNVNDQDTDHEEGYQKITDGGPENSDHSDTLTPN